MRRARFITTLTTFTVALLVLAPDALARQTGGEGLYGQTTDKVITSAMFLVILFFPTGHHRVLADPVASGEAQALADGRGQASRRQRRLARRLVAEPTVPATVR